MSKVNLDALIPRADFGEYGRSGDAQSRFQKLELAHLLPNSESNFSSRYHLLRKPDFQRETNEWDKKRICDLIDCFISGSFIPSIILWENTENGNIYVIDGAHRLSALLAYINDDYGDKDVTHNFYGYNTIPEAEILLADSTRKYVNSRIGAFVDVMKDGGPKANGLKTHGFDLQWIGGDVKKAEDSFFKINQQGVILTPTEKELCKSREMPTCIATRAIIKGGTGTQYWKGFKAENQEKIKEIADELNKLLFLPPFDIDGPSILVSNPLGGSITNATPMVFELLKIIKEKYKLGKEVRDTVNGAETLDYLIITRKIIWKMLSKQPGSLGLFPSVYFYNSVGKYIQSVFLGIAQLLIENEPFDSIFLPKFTKARERMESFLVNNKVFLTQLNRTYGSKKKSYRHIKGFFQKLIELINEGHTDNDIILKLKASENVLNENEKEEGRFRGSRFSKELKKAFDTKSEIENTIKCKICGGYIHPFSKSHDHVLDKKLGGTSDSSNVQLTHMYCNNSKDKLISMGIYIPITDI